MSECRMEHLRLIEEVEMFDPSDNYHQGDGELQDESYYAAIDRVVALLDGRISSWTDTEERP